MLFRVLLAALTAAAMLLVVPPAEAAAAKPVIRYAGLGSCLQSDGGRRPCGPWRLWLSDGRVVKLPDARRTVAEGEYAANAVVAVTRDGAQAAYFRERDGALMIWAAATGKTRRIPKVTWPDDLRMTALTLAPRGRFVGLRGLLLPSEREAERIVDTATGKTFTLPKGYQSWGFSPDGRHLAAGNNRMMVIYTTGTWSVKLRRSVYMRGDLGRDGVTVARTFWSDGGPPRNRVRIRNLATGATRTVSIRLGKGEIPLRARWDAAGRLDVLTRTDRRLSGGEYRRTHTWYRLDRATGRLRRLDSFAIPSSVGEYVLPVTY